MLEKYSQDKPKLQQIENGGEWQSVNIVDRMQRYRVKFKKEDCVLNLKEEIAWYTAEKEYLYLDPVYQVLYICGHLFPDNEKVKEYHLTSIEALHLVRKLPTINEDISLDDPKKIKFLYTIQQHVSVKNGKKVSEPLDPDLEQFDYIPLDSPNSLERSLRVLDARHEDNKGRGDLLTPYLCVVAMEYEEFEKLEKAPYLGKNSTKRLYFDTCVSEQVSCLTSSNRKPIPYRPILSLQASNGTIFLSEYAKKNMDFILLQSQLRKNYFLRASEKDFDLLLTSLNHLIVQHFDLGNMNFAQALIEIFLSEQYYYSNGQLCSCHENSEEDDARLIVKKYRSFYDSLYQIYNHPELYGVGREYYTSAQNWIEKTHLPKIAQDATLIDLFTKGTAAFAEEIANKRVESKLNALRPTIEDATIAELEVFDEEKSFEKNAQEVCLLLQAMLDKLQGKKSGDPETLNKAIQAHRGFWDTINIPSDNQDTAITAWAQSYYQAWIEKVKTQVERRQEEREKWEKTADEEGKGTRKSVLSRLMDIIGINKKEQMSLNTYSNKIEKSSSTKVDSVPENSSSTNNSQVKVDSIVENSSSANNSQAEEEYRVQYGTNCYTVKAHPSTTFAKVKIMIKNILNDNSLDISSFTLYIGGKAVNDLDRIEEYHLKRHSTIHLSIKSPSSVNNSQSKEEHSSQLHSVPAKVEIEPPVSSASNSQGNEEHPSQLHSAPAKVEIEPPVSSASNSAKTWSIKSLAEILRIEGLEKSVKQLKSQFRYWDTYYGLGANIVGSEIMDILLNEIINTLTNQNADSSFRSLEIPDEFFHNKCVVKHIHKEIIASGRKISNNSNREKFIRKLTAFRNSYKIENNHLIKISEKVDELIKELHREVDRFIAGNLSLKPYDATPHKIYVAMLLQLFEEKIKGRTRDNIRLNKAFQPFEKLIKDEGISSLCQNIIELYQNFKKENHYYGSFFSGKLINYGKKMQSIATAEDWKRKSLDNLVNNLHQRLGGYIDMSTDIACKFTSEKKSQEYCQNMIDLLNLIIDKVQHKDTKINFKELVKELAFTKEFSRFHPYLLISVLEKEIILIAEEITALAASSRIAANRLQVRRDDYQEQIVPTENLLQTSKPANIDGNVNTSTTLEVESSINNSFFNQGLSLSFKQFLSVETERERGSISVSEYWKKIPTIQKILQDKFEQINNKEQAMRKGV